MNGLYDVGLLNLLSFLQLFNAGLRAFRMQASESIIAHDAVTEDVVGAVTRVRETNQRHRALKESGNI